MTATESKTVYVIRDREGGNVIDKFETYQDAKKELIEYEEGDKREGIYTPDFYEIAIIEGENPPFTAIVDEIKCERCGNIADFLHEEGKTSGTIYCPYCDRQAEE